MVCGTEGVYLRLRLDEGRRGYVATENVPDWGLDLAELESETNDNAEHQCHNEELECPQSRHRSGRAVEDQDYEHIDNGYGAASDKRNLNENIKGDCSTNDLSK